MISKKISKKMEAGSMIRKMFEEGNRLRELHGPENVFDFSLGNPDLEPPQAVLDTIAELASQKPPKLHSYMSNNGHLSTRTAIADMLSAKSGLSVLPSHVCMTVGAAGAMNAVLKSLLDDGDEVIILAPFFMEYLSYIDNAGGIPVIIQTADHSFLPDIDKIRQAITPKTKAIIINSPNNPSGAIYSREILEELNTSLLESGQLIHVVSDEPYAELVYDGEETPASMRYLKNIIVCYSWSKSLSLPGERIGYAAVSPRHEDVNELSAAVTYCNRIQGSVNAPSFFQKVVEVNLNARADIPSYERRRNLLYDIVTKAGFSCEKPKGALYLFPKAPYDDVLFAADCVKHNLLVVPGSAFSAPGYFRLAFCVPESVIVRSEKVFKEVAEQSI